MTSAASQDSATPQSVISRALQHALQSSDGLLEWLPIGVCVCDAEGYLVQYNNRAAELWGQFPVIGNRGHRFTGAYKVYRPTESRFRSRKLLWLSCSRLAARSATASS
jgi:PAS domain-containing protein